ncbi:unnamed protein product, partial [Porites lobata]
MGEEARDLGVPRKEWILMNHAMKEKYFANGLREFLADDYFFVGVMIGTALLQNGQLPYFLPLHVIDRLVNKREVDKCVINIQWGLDVFKLTRYVRQVANGRRRPLKLSSILIFVTEAAEEPALGFIMDQSI